MCKCFKDLFTDEYTFGAKVMRWSFGLLFLLVGVKKLRMGYTGFADALVGGDGNLAAEIPNIILYVYGLIIPAAELLAGAALLANKYVQEAYTAIALMYLSFIFGQMYDGNTSKVGTEYFPSLVALCLAVFFWKRSSR